METKTIINPKMHVAKVGDIYDMTFKTIGIPFLSDLQLAAIKRSVNQNDNFKIKDVFSTSGEAVFRVEIVKNPFPIAVAIQAITASLVGLFILLSLSKVEQIINTPEGKTSNIATSVGLALGIITLSAIGLQK